MPTRARQIELLVDKSENLNQQAFRFKKQSVALKRAMYCTHLKITLMVAFAVIVRAPPPWPVLSVCAFNRHTGPQMVVFFIVLGICGTDFKRCEAKHHR